MNLTGTSRRAHLTVIVHCQPPLAPPCCSSEVRPRQDSIIIPYAACLPHSRNHKYIASRCPLPNSQPPQTSTAGTAGRTAGVIDRLSLSPQGPHFHMGHDMGPTCCSRFTVGSSPHTSSPTAAEVMACSIAGPGRVT